MNTCSSELEFVLCYKWYNYCSQLKINRLSGEIEIFIILFKLAELVKFDLALN